MSEKKSLDEIMAKAKELDVDLPEEVLDAIAGGTIDYDQFVNEFTDKQRENAMLISFTLMDAKKFCKEFEGEVFRANPHDYD